MRASLARTRLWQQGGIEMIRKALVQARQVMDRNHDDPRVLIASNRLPVTVVREAGHVRLRRSSGGLASGLRRVARNWPVRWYGWNGLASDEECPRAFGALKGQALVSVPLTSAEVSGFYSEYCNSMLWPVLHGMWDNVAVSDDSWRRYTAVNMRFAEAILSDCRPSDRIWVHDYHLFLLPQLLRKLRRDSETPIAFFLHTPFPRPDVFARIPQSRALIHGILGADLIGFHTAEYAAHFRDAARDAGYVVTNDSVIVDGREARITVRPMGIDADAFAQLGNDPEVIEEAGRLRASYKKILLGVDRLDYTKGIPQRLLAFEMLLQNQPELCGQVSLIQIAVPTRTDSACYQDLRRIVENTVAHINGKYGRSGWTPIEYLYDTVDLNTLGTLYRAADVMLVTPCSDGLNLVAKEFVATRTDGDGVLVLSKYAGAAKELTSALQVDPHRLRDLADAFYCALTMTMPERKRRMAALMRAITANGVDSWIDSFVGGDSVRVPAPIAN